MDSNISNRAGREPWNKGKLVGQKAPFKPKDIGVMRARMVQERERPVRPSCDVLNGS